MEAADRCSSRPPTGVVFHGVSTKLLIGVGFHPVTCLSTVVKNVASRPYNKIKGLLTFLTPSRQFVRSFRFEARVFTGGYWREGPKAG